jgi:hypothetical protein
VDADLAANVVRGAERVVIEKGKEERKRGEGRE